MNDSLTNRLRSVKACIATANLDENRPVWEGKAPLGFGEDLAELTADTAVAEDIAARASSAAKGYADAKDEAEGPLETLCYKSSRALSSHFKKSGDLTRLAKVNFKLGYYQKLRDQHLIAAATDLIAIGTTASSETGADKRGVTPALIAELQAARDKFASIDSAPRTGIVNRSTLLKDLDAKVAALMEKLDDLDDLVIQYDGTPAGRHFIAAWRQARLIVDSGHAPAADDDDDSDVPPANPPTP